MEVSTGSLKVTTSTVESTVEVALRITGAAVSAEATPAPSVATGIVPVALSIRFGLAVICTFGTAPVSADPPSVKVM